ncbi:hypothetical protein H9W91_07465 [Streptomyces alfalfae]|uniref:hypothetical protein n=1 Tax=Streptomyces alfalfae TaxID=1642299 RepID=UPI001BAB75A8|nr:hypothetical protein [Streptomyces alfalfae]QUI30715.1 hypothetical protein H9W91_07465 [Streptomyces alfalfae]
MRKAFHRKPALSNVERNVQRILHPPKPTLRDQFWRACWKVEEWWCRHVSQRELFRQLDAMRAVLKASREHPAPEDAHQQLEHFRTLVAAEHRTQEPMQRSPEDPAA